MYFNYNKNGNIIQLERRKNMIIGICGKSGSGKTTISNYLKEIYQEAVVVVDIDKIGHKSYSNEEVRKKIIDQFSDKVLTNNEVDRKKLAPIVFNSKDNMHILEEITWGYMKKEIDQIIDDNKQKIIVLDWLLLPYTDYYNMCDLKILLDIPFEIRKERVLKRDKIAEENFLERDNNAPNYKKEDFDIILKDTTTETLKRMVKIYDKSFISRKF